MFKKSLKGTKQVKQMNIFKALKARKYEVIKTWT